MIDNQLELTGLSRFFFVQPGSTSVVQTGVNLFGYLWDPKFNFSSKELYKLQCGEKVQDIGSIMCYREQWKRRLAIFKKLTNLIVLMNISLFSKYERFFSFLAGVMLALSAPSIHIFFMIFPAFSWLYISTISAKNEKVAFLTGFLFGMGYFIGGIYWIIYPSLTTDQWLKWIPAPFGVVFIPFYFSIYFGIAAALTKFLNKTGFYGLLIFSGMFTLADWCIGNIMGGFPMMTMSYIWAYSTEMLQSISLVGTYGMTFVLVFCAASPASYVINKDVISYSLSVILLISMFYYGNARLKANPTEYNKDIYLRILQIGKTKNLFKKNDDNSYEAITRDIKSKLLLSHRPSLVPITHLIWPESSLPFITTTGYDDLTKILASDIPARYLITGGSFLVINRQNSTIQKEYNSMIVIDKYAGIINHYHKVHLVPFGEFLVFYDALKKVFPWIGSIAGTFASGTERHNIKINNTPPFIPAICYEIGFSEEIFNKDAEWIINISNNSWFGVSSQSGISLVEAMARSVEFGIPIALSTKSGVSAIIDSYGRVKDYIPQNQTDLIDTYLPKKSNDKTFYSKHITQIKYAPAGLFFVFGFLCLLEASKRIRKKEYSEAQ